MQSQHTPLCLSHCMLLTAILVTMGLRGPAPEKSSHICLKSSSTLKHCSTSPTQPPVHSRFGWYWQRRKKAPSDRQNPASSAAVPETRHQQARSRVHQNTLHTPAFLSFSFHGAHSPQAAWHAAGSGTSTTKEQLQVQRLGFPTTPFSLGSLHLTISDTSDTFRNALCCPYRCAQSQVYMAYFEGCHI